MYLIGDGEEMVETESTSLKADGNLSRGLYKDFAKENAVKWYLINVNDLITTVQSVQLLRWRP